MGKPGSKPAGKGIGFKRGTILTVGTPLSMMTFGSSTTSYSMANTGLSAVVINVNAAAKLNIARETTYLIHNASFRLRRFTADELAAHSR